MATPPAADPPSGPAPTRFAPLETWYAGIKYRSRTEARWAVFFESAGVAARYEAEGFQLDDGAWYLPDFVIGSSARGVARDAAAQRDAYIEIKGREPSDAEVLKARSLARNTGMPVYLFWYVIAS
jgi:hypothetical protein